MDLQSDYLGIKLKNPLVVSSCSLYEKLENIKKWNKQVLRLLLCILYSKKIRYDDTIDCCLHYGTDQFVETLTYFPIFGEQKSFFE
jgi:hypothetical protein